MLHDGINFVQLLLNTLLLHYQLLRVSPCQPSGKRNPCIAFASCKLVTKSLFIKHTLFYSLSSFTNFVRLAVNVKHGSNPCSTVCREYHIKHVVYVIDIESNMCIAHKMLPCLPTRDTGHHIVTWVCHPEYKISIFCRISKTLYMNVNETKLYSLFLLYVSFQIVNLLYK